MFKILLLTVLCATIAYTLGEAPPTVMTIEELLALGASHSDDEDPNNGNSGTEKPLDPYDKYARLINKVFTTTTVKPRTTTPRTTTQGSCIAKPSNPEMTECVCVPYHRCNDCTDNDEVVISVDDERFFENCYDKMDVCCYSVKEEKPDTTANHPVVEPRCGIRNVNGIDLRLTGDIVSG